MSFILAERLSCRSFLPAFPSFFARFLKNLPLKAGLLLVRCLQDFRLTVCQEQLGGLRQILHDMEPVCTLHSLGSAKRGGFSVFPSTIPTHHANLWLLAHPGRGGFRFPIREQVHD